MNWNRFVDVISPYVVKISTRNSIGTGFLCGKNEHGWSGIATAYHVIEGARINEGNIEITGKGGSITLNDTERNIEFDYDNDVAVIKYHGREEIFFPDELPLIHSPDTLGDDPAAAGCEAGWMGYPGSIYNDQCFFAGNVSAFTFDLL